MDDYEDEDFDVEGDDEEVGADEVEEILQEYGISGDDEDIGELVGELVGARRRRGRRRKRRGRRSVRTRRIVGLSVKGRPRQFPLLFTRSVGVADAAAATLVGTADRRSLLRSLFIEGNSAAGVRVFGVSVTQITINGRNCQVGTGFLPASLAFGEFAQVAGDDDAWSLGILDQGGNANVTVQNDSGAAADLYVGGRAETTDS